MKRMHYRLASFKVGLPSTIFDFGSSHSDAAKAGSRVAGPLAGVLGNVFKSIAGMTGDELEREGGLVMETATAYITGNVPPGLRAQAVSCAEGAANGYAETLSTGYKPLIWVGDYEVHRWVAHH
jgi:hypothetical protein